MTTLKVNEVFGPTIQGEGPSTGRHCLFIRLSQCNLHCTWCDTPYTWAFTENKATQHQSGVQYSVADESHEIETEEVWIMLEKLWHMTRIPTTVVISGGEPMLQQRHLDELIHKLLAWGHRVEIETAGTIVPTREWSGRVQFNVSPKLDHSGNSLLARRNGDALLELARLNSIFKFVVSHPIQYIEVKELIELGSIPRPNVWIMPEGTTIEATRDHAREIIHYALDQGWNFTLRSHVIIWGNERAK